MTEELLREIEALSDSTVPYYVPTLIAEIRRLRAEVEQAQQERDAARETVTAVMVRLVPVVSDADYDVVGIVEQAVADLAAAKADAAHPPALPPLPKGWEPYDEGAHTHATFRRGSDMVEAIPGSAEVVVDALARPEELITVLRHAEAAHLKLKGDGK